jgi:hypothetical protein
MDSEQAPQFSTALQERLRKSVKDGGMTLRKAIDLLEAFLEDKDYGVLNLCNFPVYSFKVPAAIKHSQICTECLGVYKSNLEACGFRQSKEPQNHYGDIMQPGRFIFIKDAPHRCNQRCEKERYCDVSLIPCDYNDSECHTLLVCL